MLVPRIALGCGCLVFASQVMACFTVVSSDDRLIYRGMDAPLDMSRPIHESLPALVPDGYLIFDLANACPQLRRDAVTPQRVVAQGTGAAVIRVLTGDATLAADTTGTVAVASAALLADLGARDRAGTEQ